MLLKRYKNRKLYSPDSSMYINFAEISDENVKNLYVICDQTKTDITVSTLKMMFANRITSMDFSDAMVKSQNIIDRLNAYTPNTSVLASLKKPYHKYDAVNFADDLKAVTE